MHIALLYSTYATPETATAIARTLLDEHLVACCNILPAGESLYRWQGTLTTAPEVVMLCKTTSALAPSAAARIAALHPYDCPAILTLAAEANAPFAQWVQEATSTE